MERDRERDREEMEEQFRERLQSVKDEFARELVESAQEVEAKYKRMIGTIPVSKKGTHTHTHNPQSTTHPNPAPKNRMQRRWSTQQGFNFDDISETQIERFVAEKEEMLQTAETRHKHKIKTMEEQMRYVEGHPSHHPPNIHPTIYPFILQSTLDHKLAKMTMTDSIQERGTEARSFMGVR